MSKKNPRIGLWAFVGSLLGVGLVVPAVVPTSIEFFVGYIIFLVVLMFASWVVVGILLSRFVHKNLPAIQKVLDNGYRLKPPDQFKKRI